MGEKTLKRQSAEDVWRLVIADEIKTAEIRRRLAHGDLAADAVLSTVIRYLEERLSTGLVGRIPRGL